MSIEGDTPFIYCFFSCPRVTSLRVLGLVLIMSIERTPLASIYCVSAALSSVTHITALVKPICLYQQLRRCTAMYTPMNKNLIAMRTPEYCLCLKSIDEAYMHMQRFLITGEVPMSKQRFTESLEEGSVVSNFKVKFYMITVPCDPDTGQIDKTILNQLLKEDPS